MRKLSVVQSIFKSLNIYWEEPGPQSLDELFYAFNQMILAVKNPGIDFQYGTCVIKRNYTTKPFKQEMVFAVWDYNAVAYELPNVHYELSASYMVASLSLYFLSSFIDGKISIYNLSDSSFRITGYDIKEDETWKASDSTMLLVKEKGETFDIWKSLASFNRP